MQFLVTFLSTLIVFSLGTLANQIHIKSCEFEVASATNPILYPSSIQPVFSWTEPPSQPFALHPSMTDSDHHFWVSSSRDSEFADALIGFTNIPASGCKCKLVFLNPGKKVIQIGVKPVLRVLEITAGGKAIDRNPVQDLDLDLDGYHSESESIDCTADMTFRVGISREISRHPRYVTFYRSNGFLRWGQPPEGWVLEQSCGTATGT
jgi:hypothetical protein